jgi:group I intron endonuclease
MYTVYKLISPSNKCYIGLTSRTFEKRLRQHISDYNRGAHNCRKLCNAFKTYPPEFWSHEILFTSIDENEAKEKEIEFIRNLKTQEYEYGYNVLMGGVINRSGLITSEETKRKLSEVGKRRINTPETRERISKSNIGKHSFIPSNETRQKMSQAHKGCKPWNTGKKLPKEMVDKMIRTGENNPFYGKTHSNETKDKIRASLARYRQMRATG